MRGLQIRHAARVDACGDVIEAAYRERPQVGVPGEVLVRYWCARLVLSLPLRCQEPRGSQK